MNFVNSLDLSKEYIKANFDKSYYKENPDGSIDIELTLYFKPQSYFYLGIIISGTTLILCLGYLGYAFYRKRGGKLSPHPAPPKQGMGGTTLPPTVDKLPARPACGRQGQKGRSKSTLAGGQIKGKNKSKSVIRVKK